MIPWHLRIVLDTDLYFINRIFMPFAHWVDWRFHYSPYQQAYVVLHVSMGFNVLGALWTAGHMRSWVAIIVLLAAGLMTFVSRFWFKRLRECQRQYEKDPTTLCYAQFFFMALPHASFARSFYLILGAQLVGANVWVLAWHPNGRNALDAVFSSWLMLCGVGLYLAGAFPPQGGRREKKTATMLQPAMAGVKS